jgi:hypothetical protein
MSKNRTLYEWTKDWYAGKFSGTDRQTQCEAGWYDWFCKEASLAGRLKKLAGIVVKIANSPRIKNDWYVWFKNNCPCVGPLYDDIRISSPKERDNEFVITVNDKREDAPVCVYAPSNDYKEPVFKGTRREVIKWFNDPNYKKPE